MKKLLFLGLGFAFFAASCSSKETQISATDADSTIVSAETAAPIVMDSAAPMVVDSAATMDNMKMDSAMAPAK